MPERKYTCSPAAEARLREMDYAALSQHLDEISQLPDVTGDYVELILKLLEEKYPNPMKIDEKALQRARADLWESYIGSVPEKKSKRRSLACRILRGLAIAAILATLFCVTLAAVGGNRSIYVTFGDGTMRLHYTGKADTNLASYPQAASSGSFSELRQEVAKYSSHALIPTEEPWDTALVELNSRSSSHGESVFARYEGENGTIMFRYLFYNSDARPQAEIQVNNGASERYTVEGVDFYLSRNYEQSVIFWVVDQVECSIWGDFSTKEARAMVDSLFAE